MNLVTAPDIAPSVRIAGPGPLVVALRPAATPPQHRPDACTVQVVEDATLLHGWRSAATALQLLQLVAAPSTLLPYSAAVHASRALEPRAPGSAALCGLARALLMAPARGARLAREVRDRAAHQVAVGGLHPATFRALDAVRTLAEAAPDDPAVLAPLFLRLYRLPAGAQVRLLDAVPAAVVTGAVELTLAGPGVDLTVGGLTGGGLTSSGRADVERDVAGFTAALRPTPRHELTAEPAVPQPVVPAPGIQAAVSA